MLRESISKNAIILSIMAVATTAVVAATYLSTKTNIADNRRAAEEKALLDIIPKSRHNNSMLDSVVAVNDEKYLGLRTEKKIHVAKQNNSVVGVIIPATARDGYSGDIDIIVGINTDGTVAGVRALNHRETPGLGDKVDRKKSDWIDSFTGKSLVNPGIERWKVKKDKGIFDQFTGATITPRAVTNAVKQALLYFEENREQILKTLSDSELAQSGDNNG